MEPTKSFTLNYDVALVTDVSRLGFERMVETVLVKSGTILADPSWENVIRFGDTPERLFEFGTKVVVRVEPHKRIVIERDDGSVKSDMDADAKNVDLLLTLTQAESDALTKIAERMEVSKRDVIRTAFIHYYNL